MIKKKNPKLWAFAKEICRIKNEGRTFANVKELRSFVKEHKHLLPAVVDGWAV
ncbi:hypothetical protein [Paenibacillus polymyxa]|uniref:hypothetical protein n=1 Tax=Paenibacillus polymyxa TaxID=1406 RepID=UPI002AB4228B|nr:hypothetical protein [Paenibacillus polymyxa]MDY8021228.1 hypothetical protein [Paenibacillus polymyxa]